jgi:hypothetical protein
MGPARATPPEMPLDARNPTWPKPVGFPGPVDAKGSGGDPALDDRVVLPALYAPAVENCNVYENVRNIVGRRVRLGDPNRSPDTDVRPCGDLKDGRPWAPVRARPAG